MFLLYLKLKENYEGGVNNFGTWAIRKFISLTNCQKLEVVKY